MKREILFRGKSIDNGEWVEGTIHFNGKYILSNKHRNNYHEWVEIIPETVGQFTGIIDISGEELFEWDIYNMGDDNIRYVIVWRNCMFIGKQVGNNSYAGLDYWESEIKKVGNIYDNKELLK